MQQREHLPSRQQEPWGKRPRRGGLPPTRRRPPLVWPWRASVAGEGIKERGVEWVPHEPTAIGASGGGGRGSTATGTADSTERGASERRE